MKLLLVAALAALVVASATAASAWTGRDPTDTDRICATPRRVGRVIDYLFETDPALNYTNTGVVVKVYSRYCDSFVPLYERGARNLFTPASNVKLLTMGAAYLALRGEQGTPGYQFTTTVGADAGASQLCVRASGDPTFATANLTQLAADAAAALPANSSFGELVLDASRWDPAVGGYKPFDGSWEWGDLRASYAAQPTPAVLDGNFVYVRVTPGAAEGDPVLVEPVDPANGKSVNAVSECVTGPATLDPLVHERFSYGYRYGSSSVTGNTLVVGGTLPAGSGAFNLRVSVGDTGASYAEAARQALAAAGVAVDAVRVGRCSAAAQTVASHSSAQFTDLANTTLQWSNNLYSEEFLRALGDASGRAANEYADNAGKNEVRRVLAEAGVDTNLFVQRDGSGLSRYNLAAPEGIAQVLEALADSDEFISLLPVAGRSGTLTGRFINATGEGVVHAKTGSLTGVNALSGYILRDDFPPVIFSILQNGSPNFGSVVRPALDNIVNQLAKLSRCRRRGRYIRFDDGVSDDEVFDAAQELEGLVEAVEAGAGATPAF